jgi:hypothetical protein
VKGEGKGEGEKVKLRVRGKGEGGGGRVRVRVDPHPCQVSPYPGTTWVSDPCHDYESDYNVQSDILMCSEKI